FSPRGVTRMISRLRPASLRTARCGAAVVMCAAASLVPAQSDPRATAARAPAAPAGQAGSADELLTALETADRGLTSLTADVLYDKTLVTIGDTQQREGKLFFQAGDSGRRFAIRFDTTKIGRRVDTTPELYAFD